MLNSIPSRRRRVATAALSSAVLGAALLVAQPAQAGPIPLDTFMQFSFTDAGEEARGCFPSDPDAAICVGSAATFADAPAWTFDGAAFLTVVDGFLSGDRFDIFDFGVFIGSTSLPGATEADCESDPVVCLATPGMSSGVFALGAGAHSLTMIARESLGGGSGFFRVSADAGAVPEPASLALALGALGLLWGANRRNAAGARSVA